jgi:hypothetical protein
VKDNAGATAIFEGMTHSGIMYYVLNVTDVVGLSEAKIVFGNASLSAETGKTGKGGRAGWIITLVYQSSSDFSKFSPEVSQLILFPPFIGVWDDAAGDAGVRPAGRPPPQLFLFLYAPDSRPPQQSHTGPLLA